MPSRSSDQATLRALGLALALACLPGPAPAASLSELGAPPRSNRFT